MLAIGLAITQEKGDGQTFQVSSGRISKMTGDHFHAFLLPEYCVHSLESDYEYVSYPTSLEVFSSFAFVGGEREEGNTYLQLPSYFE